MIRSRTAIVVMCAIALVACDRRGQSGKPSAAELKKKLAQIQAPGDPVKFEALQQFLPSNEVIAKDGWQKSDLTGMALSVPIKGAQASLTLKKADAQIVINIIDTVFNQSLFAPVAAFLADGFATTDADGYKKRTTMQGFQAFEEWSTKDRTAGITVLVGKRFLIHLQGTGLNGIDPVKAIASQINMTTLADLK